jgi:very-short-patch-repair endonuclease/predicted transcriptional regulator of viral defense system
MAWDVRAVVGEVGWITAADLHRRVSPRTVGNWVSSGRLVVLRPGVYALPSSAPAWRVRLGAALIRGNGVASHVTALALWGLVEHPPGPVHVTVDLTRSAHGSKGVTVHRSAGIDAERRRHDGFSVTSVERSVVDAWGQPAPLGRADIRAAAITAVRRRQCSAADVALELVRRPRLPGRAELSRLVELLAAGCQSELEIWGCLNVLRAPGMPPFVQQRRIVVRGQVFWLDAAYDEVQLAVEMDGAAWHGSRKQREDDIRRDALLATVGWQTLRFAYRRLTSAPEACRRDILAVHAARRALFLPNGVRWSAGPA